VPTLRRGVSPSDYTLPAGLEDKVMSPALVVDLAKVRHNLAVMMKLVHGDADRWRPHLKTTKCSRVWAEALKAGVRHFKVATTREAGGCTS
jgi:D-serine deaminase-like pyridoxal phosphate-dependent protein